jgi:hypothetical protein
LIEIECVMLPNYHLRREQGRTFERLYRLAAGEPSLTVHHIYRSDLYDGPGGWSFSPRLRYYVLAEPPPYGWCYAFRFTDGTIGTCQVSNVNAALTSLGWQVDRRGDADRD